jgi:hypothetical protein
MGQRTLQRILADTSPDGPTIDNGA